MRRQLTLLVLISSVLLIHLQCSSERASLYPLAEGWAWEYEVSSGSAFGGGSASMTVTNMAERKVGDAVTIPRRIEVQSAVSFLGRESSMTSFAFVSTDEEGFSWAASQSPTDGEPVIREPGDYFLKHSVEVGDSWEQGSLPSLMTAGTSHESLLVSIVVSGTNETVTVPAGTFDGCVKITAATKPRVSLEEHDWYCPGVGLVRQSIENKSTGLLSGGGKTTFQLTSYVKG